MRGQIATPIPNLIFLEPHVPADDFERARAHYEAAGIGRVTNYCFPRRRDALEYGRRPLLMGEMFDSVFVGNLDFQALGTQAEHRVLPLLFDMGQVIHRHTLPTLRSRIKCGWFGSHFVLLHADSPSTGDVQESKIHSLRRSQWQAHALFGPDRNYDGTLRDLPCL